SDAPGLKALGAFRRWQFHADFLSVGINRCDATTPRETCCSVRTQERPRNHAYFGPTLEDQEAVGTRGDLVSVFPGLWGHAPYLHQVPLFDKREGQWRQR